MLLSSMMANTESYRLVRCPKCLNILPEPPHVTVYRCGGCGTTLRAKIRASNGQHVAKKQVRQDSDNYSVATAASNGVHPQTKDHASTEIAMDSSCIHDAPSTEHDSNGAKNYQSGHVVLPENNGVEIDNNESKNHHNFEGQDLNTNTRMEGPADLENPNANSKYQDSDEAENHVMEQPEENSETCREDDGTECHLNAFENNKLSSDMSKATVSMQDAEQKESGQEQQESHQGEHAANKKSYLVRVLSRSCDLRASINSLDFHSARTSLQSKSFRASEPLQSKIMNTVDVLKDDLSELFDKPSESKPKAYPPRPSKQDGHIHMTRAALTSSAPLAAHYPAAKHSGHAARISRSGQVAPRRGLPSLRYRRHRVYPCHHNVQMEMRPCRHECCHSCQPPCYRSCKQEPAAAMHMPPPAAAKEIKRRPVPRNHCRPVLRGAPFVICSHCVRLVQLPTDFAVPSRGTRRLRCGACSEVLSYSYRDPGRKTPRSPFGGDEYSTDGYEAAADDGHYGGGFEQADPVSYSEEYGLSFGVGPSSSSEDGQPLYVSRNSSFNTVDEMAGGRDGKLHRLMGYSSATELLRHSPDLFESFDGRTPGNARAHVVDRKGKGVCDAGEPGDAVKRSKARSGALPLQGILKKGIHGLESLKLRS